MIDLKQEIKQLLDHTNGYVLSLYQQTHRRGADVDQGPIQFKNLMREAEEKLEPHVERGVLPRIMSKLDALQRNVDFWRHRTEGLALFVLGEEIKTFDLPESVQNRVVVGPHAHILPLIEVYQHLSPHYVLELFKDRFTLYHGDGRQLEEMQKEDLPKSFGELYDDFDSENRMHVGGHGNREGGMHANRAKPEEVEKDKQKYYHYLNNELTPLLRNLGEPVVLAGLTENIADYKAIISDRIYLDETLEKPIRDLGDDGYSERIRGIYAKLDEQQVERQMSALERALTNGGATTDQAEIQTALEAGRVETLLIRTEYNEENREYLDQLVYDCNQQGGEVVMIPVTTAAMDKRVAVLYRY